jgi:SAM-dependent methyltransferase
MNCYYCDRIAASDPTYIPRAAAFDTGSEAPRCALHWRFRCDHCGELDSYMARFYCPTSGRLLCREAGAAEVETVYGDFPPSGYWWALACPDCGDEHPSLDYAEHTGVHPWQIDPALETTRRWLSPEAELARYPRPRLAAPDMGALTDEDSDRNWSANADTWDAGYDERGDANRTYYSDPVLLAFLGDVAGRRVLDAGSGGGYLARLLARRGASVVAVENARRFHELALARQAREPLDIAFHHGSIAAMPYLGGASVDLAVANYVLMDVRDYEGAIAEVARVLKPGGAFVFTLLHHTSDGRWHRPAPDSPRREDRDGWLVDRHFERRALYTQWGDLAPVLGFHRPLRDYLAACKRRGLALRDLEEPELSEEGRRVLPAPEVREAGRIAVSYVIKTVKA